MTDPCREMIRLQGEERERKRLFLTITLFLKNIGTIVTFAIYSIYFGPIRRGFSSDCTCEIE